MTRSREASIHHRPTPGVARAAVGAVLGLSLLVLACAQDSLLEEGPCCNPGLRDVEGLSVAASATGGEGRTTWVALEPGRAPSGYRAELRSSSGGTAVAAVIAGGFDPVRIGAREGDTIRVAVTDTTGRVLNSWLVPVREEEAPPIIVRTEPPPRKRDVPLNAMLVVVFSEPIDPATVTGETVKLLRGTVPVPGRLVLESPGWRAVLLPDSTLLPDTEYVLRVEGVRDLTGTALARAELVPFTTGDATAGQVRVVTETSGGSIDPDGYRIVLDGDVTAATAIGGNDSTDVSLPPGSHTVSLTGLAVHCVAADSTLAIEVPSGGMVTTTFAITCVASGGRQLTFVVQPGDVSAGMTFTPAVQVAQQDSAGNLIDTPSDSVTISVELASDFGRCGAEVWCGPLGVTRRALAGGQATFSGLWVPVAGGPYVLLATTPGVPPAISAPFTVSPGAAALATPGVPLNSVAFAGEPFTVAVTFMDQYGNAASPPAGSVTLDLGPGSPATTLKGTRTRQAGTLFDDLVLDVPGTGYSLLASIPGLSSGASTGFRVSARARTLLFQRFDPMPAIAGFWLRQSIDVAALDTLGRLDSTFSGWVGLRIADNPGGALAWTSQRLAANGMATGIPYRVDRAGTGYTLEAVAEGISTGPSAPFDVLPATSILGFLRAGDILVASATHAGSGVAHSNRDWASCPEGAQAFAWAPDGMGLAWGTRCSGDLTIVPQAADGSTPIWLPRFPGLQASWSGLAWSVDGREVLVAITRATDGALLTYRADAVRGETPISVANYGPGEDLDWSPDRTRVVFRSRRDDPSGDLYVADADGGGLSRLTFSAADDRNPAWSPDGTRIAFVSDRAGGWDLYTMSAGGSDIVRLTSGGSSAGVFAPDWSPDGSQLTFVQEDISGASHLMLINADGSGLRVIGQDGILPAWRP